MPLRRALKMKSWLFLGVLLLNVMIDVPVTVFGQGNEKLDPVLKLLVANPSVAQTLAIRPLVRMIGAESTVGVFIRTTSGLTTFNTPGVQVQTVIGDIAVATVPISRLVELATQTNVVSLHAAKVWTPTLNVSVPETKADQVRTQFGETGRNVIVGVIDTGIDWRHLDFRSATDTTKTRIKFLWDMSDPTGPPPTAFATSGGTESDEAKINSALAGTATINERDVVGHGTHVAGIAAGNGRATGNGQPSKVYVGMAPEADLIIVKATQANAPLSFSSSDVVIALNYIDAKAAQLGKPYVINLSLGGQQGPHDGTDPEGEAIDLLVGPGVSGKVVVTSAGNDGDKRIHARGTIISSVVDSTKRLTDLSGGFLQVGATLSLDIWTQVSSNIIPNRVLISVSGPDTTVGPYGGYDFAGLESDNSNGNVIIQNNPYRSEDVNSLVKITVKKSGTWSIKIRGVKGTASGRFDMWIYEGNAQFDASDADITTLVGDPGSAKNAITVGAYVTKNTWIDASNTTRFQSTVLGNASSFSSPGPTRDGRWKPEIAAPGQAIGSALSADATPGNGTSIFQSATILQDGRHAAIQGTSMSAPHVTGAVALLLQRLVYQKNLQRDAIEIRTALQDSARSDVFTGAVPNDKWGFGKMDVLALFQGPVEVSLASFTATADGRRVHLSWEVTSAVDHAGFRVYRSPSGREADRQPITPHLLTGGPRLTYEDVPPGPGVYAYWLADTDLAGRITFHGPVVVTFAVVPTAFRLGQSRPNPFNPTTLIDYDLPRPEQVLLRIYDILGREVRTLVNERQPAGFHQVVWDGRNDRGAAVGSGVYMYRIAAGEFVQSRKMTLMK